MKRNIQNVGVEMGVKVLHNLYVKAVTASTIPKYR